MSRASSNDSPLQPPGPSDPSTLPPQVRRQALRFAHFTDTVLGRLNRAAARLCRRCLRELQHCPDHYDQICTYHVELLARAVRRELDALHRCLCADTLEVITRSYQELTRADDHPRPLSDPPPQAPYSPEGPAQSLTSLAPPAARRQHLGNCRKR